MQAVHPLASPTAWMLHWRGAKLVGYNGVVSPGASSRRRRGSVDSVTPSVGQKRNTIFDGVELVVCSPPAPSRLM